METTDSGPELSPENAAVVSSFCEITSASNQEALFFLESHNWDLDAAVSTFLDNENSSVAVPAAPVRPTSGSLSPSPSHSPEYSPSHSPTRSRSPSPSPATRPPYQLRSKRAASGSDNKPPAAARTRGIRTLSDLNRRPAKDGSDSDSDEPNEYYTGGEKSGMLVQDPTRGGGRGSGGVGDVDSIFNQARQFAQAPQDLPSSSSSKSFTGTARTLTGEPVAAAAPQPPESIHYTITFWRNGFSINDGPLRRFDDPANADFLQSIKNSECPKELEPADRRTAVNVGLMRQDTEDYPEPVKQRGQVAFQGVGRTLGGTDSSASNSTAAAAAAAAPSLTTAPLPSLGLTVDESLPSTSIQLRLADGTRMVSRFNNHHTIRDIHAFIDASRPGGARNYRLQTMGFPPKQLSDLDQTIEQAGATNSVIIQKV